MVSERDSASAQFRTTVLPDDFSGNGISYVREADDGLFEGKIGRFYRSVTTGDSAAWRLIDIKVYSSHGGTR